MASPVVSIIIPLYNKAQYITKALKSVMSQTFTDWQCFIIDDGSTDDSASIATSVLSNDKRFTILSQKNKGVAAARNNGIKLAQGEFIAFLDADDWWDEHYLEEMMAFAKEYPDAGLYSANYVYHKPGKTHVAVNCPTGYISYPEVYLHNDAMPVWTGATIVRRDIFSTLHFHEEVRYGEDFLLWLQISFLCKVAFLDKPLAYYNNDLTQRATRQLYSPQHHMLWHLPAIPPEAAPSYITLYSTLRAIGLLKYWVSSKYHHLAEEEVKKIDWSTLPVRMHTPYTKPLILLRFQTIMMKVASDIKRMING